MTRRIRAYLMAIVAIALATAVFYAIAGVPFQVALGLGLLSCSLIDAIYPKRRRP